MSSVRLVEFWLEMVVVGRRLRHLVIQLCLQGNGMCRQFVGTLVRQWDGRIDGPSVGGPAVDLHHVLQEKEKLVARMVDAQLWRRGRRLPEAREQRLPIEPSFENGSQ